MKCPSCSSGLVQKYYSGTPVDICSGCKGVWFDDGELQPVIEGLISSGKVNDAPIELDRDVIRQNEIMETERFCPRCSTEMRKMNYAYDSNIILDKCDRCGGIWADFGEVMKLAVFRKGNPLLNRMGEAIARDRGELLNQRLGNLDSSATSSPWYWQCAPRIILPLGDSQERESLPFVVIGIALLNIIICIIQLCTSGSGTEVFYRRYGLVPVEAFSSITYSYHYITSMFIHGGVFHLAGNLLYLWIFADNIEDRLGHWTFLLLYILFGISADFTHIILSPHSNIPAIGASGAVAGTMGAYMILFPASNIKTYVYGKIMNIPAYIYIGGWIALQLANTYLTAGQKSGVAFGAHIGGFFTGLLIGTCVKFMLREE